MAAQLSLAFLKNYPMDEATYLPASTFKASATSLSPIPISHAPSPLSKQHTRAGHTYFIRKHPDYRITPRRRSTLHCWESNSLTLVLNDCLLALPLHFALLEWLEQKSV